MSNSAIISKIWNLANVLRDDGVGYGDYLKHITYRVNLVLVFVNALHLAGRTNPRKNQFLLYVRAELNLFCFSEQSKNLRS